MASARSRLRNMLPRGSATACLYNTDSVSAMRAVPSRAGGCCSAFALQPLMANCPTTSGMHHALRRATALGSFMRLSAVTGEGRRTYRQELPSAMMHYVWATDDSCAYCDPAARFTRRLRAGLPD